MADVLINHIPSTLLHMLTAILMMDIAFKGPLFPSTTKRKQIAYSGAAIVLIPDIPKLFGTILFHSMLTIPLISLALTFLYRKYLDVPSWLIWIRLTLVYYVAALFIDYLGNGVYVFYPLMDKLYASPVQFHEAYYIPFVAGLLYVRIKKQSLQTSE